ncbi:MAG: glycosyltransferase family 4 protein [Chthoniobacterales bacterium]
MLESEGETGPELGAILPAQADRVCAVIESGAERANDAASPETPILVGLLTGGNDKPYALGLASALVAQGIFVDFIGSDSLDVPELHDRPLVNFLNLRGNQGEHASFRRKATRLLQYYRRLLWYAAISRPAIFHILWNNKFEVIDRVVLMFYYRALGKRIVFTAHNINAAKRDGKDSLLNRLSLKVQYWMSDHIFVHTERMKRELLTEFDVRESKVTVIPFGINNTIPTSEMTTLEAKRGLGLSADENTALFFGQIAPYKGLEYLVAAVAELVKRNGRLRLIVAGKIKRGYAGYWRQIENEIVQRGIKKNIIERTQFIPDEEVELYFKAADVVVTPYTEIFQSGLPFLAYSFGLPIIVTDVGSLREDVVEGMTGFICKPRDSADLAKSIEGYFSSELYRQLSSRRHVIKNFANEKYSWAKVGEITGNVYRSLMQNKNGVTLARNDLSE